MDEIQEKVIALIAKHFHLNPREIQPDAHFVRDLGVDSMDAIAFILMCENEFGLTISNESASMLLTPRMAIDFIKRHL